MNPGQASCNKAPWDINTFGQNGVYSFTQEDSDFAGTDLDAGLRIENGRGAFITTVDFSATITEATFTISDDSLPSPVPLPASALLLMGALGGLGFGARRRRLRDQAA